MATRLIITDEDRNALRTFVTSARKTWRTLVLTDVFTGEAIHVNSANDLFELEAWSVAGEEGFTTPETRKRVLVDTLFEEPIDRRDTALKVTWIDSSASEHSAILTIASMAQLQRKLEEHQEAGELTPEITGYQVYAEPLSYSKMLSLLVKAGR